MHKNVYVVVPTWFVILEMFIVFPSPHSKVGVHLLRSANDFISLHLINFAFDPTSYAKSLQSRSGEQHKQFKFVFARVMWRCTQQLFSYVTATTLVSRNHTIWMKNGRGLHHATYFDEHTEHWNYKTVGTEYWVINFVWKKFITNGDKNNHGADQINHVRTTDYPWTEKSHKNHTVSRRM